MKGINVDTICCTISGSFRRFIGEVEKKMSECADNEIKVLSPTSSIITSEIDGFVFLRGDEGGAEEIEKHHLDYISQSDFLYIVNPNGYIGPSATLEIGYAIANNVPVFCSDAPSESIFDFFVTVEPSIDVIKKQVASILVPHLSRSSNMPQFQRYVECMVKSRGFEDETLRDVALLLMEEVGELAKAIRKHIGLKEDVSNNSRHKKIGHELVDCLIYLLDIANLSNIDLASTFLEKEQINSQRTWDVVVENNNTMCE